MERAKRPPTAPLLQGVPAARIELVGKIVALLRPKNRPVCPACYHPATVFKRSYRKRMELRMVGEHFVWAHCSIFRPCNEARLAAFCEANGLSLRGVTAAGDSP
jgi:hypothetical protein